MVRPKRGRRSRIIASQDMDRSVTLATSAVGQVKELWDIAAASRAHAAYLQRWHDLDLTVDMLPYLPDDAPQEVKKLRKLAATPWGRLIVSEVGQLLAVDGIHLENSDAAAPAVRIWQQNGLDARQKPVVDGANKHGMSYNLILPAVGRLDGKPTALIRGKSALRATAFYRDDFDEYPEFYIEVVPLPNSDGTVSLQITFIDDVFIHRMSSENGDGTKINYIDNQRHGMNVCPVVRFADIDLDGNVTGEILPYIPLFRRIDQDTLDRLVVQKMGAHAVRTISGMLEPPTDDEKRAARIALGVGDLLISENPDTSFGTLPGTQTDGYIKAREADIKDLSAAAQTPSYRMLGLGDNIGADAISAANESQDRKITQLRRVYGESWESSMRLGGHAAGDKEVAADFTSSVYWAPRNSESLLTLTQGLATMVNDLEIAPELVWRYLPDWSGTQTTVAKNLREERKGEQMLMEALGGATDDSSDTATGPKASGGSSPAGGGAA